MAAASGRLREQMLRFDLLRVRDTSSPKVSVLLPTPTASDGARNSMRYMTADSGSGNLTLPGAVSVLLPTLWVRGADRDDAERHLDDLIAEANSIYADAVRMATADGHRLAGSVVLFSGGNDSTTTAHLFRHIATHAGHCNTGIGIEQTRQFVRDTCAGWGLPLIEKHPPPKRSYADMVLGEAKFQPKDGGPVRPFFEGFPGPGGHGVMYRNLKERGLDAIKRDLVANPRRERMIFITGVRQSESQRRAERPAVHRDGSAVFASPIARWTKIDMNAYRKRFPDVPSNEVADLIHMSGECLCGAFAHPGELNEIAYWFPEVAAEIRELERRAAERGIKRCTWGQGKGTPCGGVCNL